MKLTLIRHGLTEGNQRRLYYGSTDIPLLPEGIAALLELRKTHIYPTAQHYYTSGMIRTEQTFTTLYGDIPHTAIPLLREMDFGDFEMCSYEDLKLHTAYQTWISGDVLQNICPNGESAQHMLHRALDGIAPIISTGEDAVCVIHGGIISSLMSVWFPLKDKNLYFYTPAPGTGYCITFENGIPQSYITVPTAKKPDND